MPSKSAAQHRLMEIVAHTKGGYDKIPQSVGKEFVRADTHSKRMGNTMRKSKKK